MTAGRRGADVAAELWQACLQAGLDSLVSAFGAYVPHAVAGPERPAHGRKQAADRPHAVAALPQQAPHAVAAPRVPAPNQCLSFPPLPSPASAPLPEIPGSRNALARGGGGGDDGDGVGNWDLAVSTFRVRANGACVLYASLHVHGVRADPAARLGPDIRPFHQEPRRLVAHRVDCLVPLPAVRHCKVRALRAPSALPAVTRDGAVPPLGAIVGAVELLAMARGIRPLTPSLPPT